MVEKTGHKKALVTARNEWINEGRPKASNNDDDEDDDFDIGAVAISGDSQTVSVPAGGRERSQKTPERDNDVPDDDDLYDATPRAPRSTNALRSAPSNDAPDDDDLEALMAEAESMDSRPGPAARSAAAANQRSNHSIQEGEDDLDALIAEAEERDRSSGQPTGRNAGSGGSADKGHDFADEEEAMQEMEGLW
jgi:replication fork protection complex subunit Csm3/Swi3